MGKRYWIFLGLGLFFLGQNLWMNPLPYAVKDAQGWSFPLFEKWNEPIRKDPRQTYRTYPKQIWPPLPFHPEKGIKESRGGMPPFSRIDQGPFVHWLGTDVLGRDLLSGLVSGLNYAILIGLTSMVPALILGYFLGFLSGYFGNHRLKISLVTWILAALFFLIALFYAFAEYYWISSISFMLMLGSFFLPGKKAKSLPLDLIIVKTIEIFQSVPGLILVILVGSLWGQSWWKLALTISFLSWTVFARYVRAEVLQTSSSEYILSAKSLGIPWIRQCFYHFLPNLWPQIRVIFMYGIAGAVMVESSLSFLGIGLPAEAISWGSMIGLGKSNFDHWWMLFFPCLSLVGFIAILHGSRGKQKLKLKTKNVLPSDKTISI